ncbi:MAG: GIY-YIG nuclease family protein [Bacteroidia bacterium]
MKRGGAVYIMTNEYRTTLYTGVTSDLKRRVFEHKNDFHPGSFTAKYKTYKLVYYEGFHRIEEAIGREKQIKAGSRKKKIEMISSFNPEWKDLYNDVLKW